MKFTKLFFLRQNCVSFTPLSLFLKYELSLFDIDQNYMFIPCKIKRNVSKFRKRFSRICKGWNYKIYGRPIRRRSYEFWVLPNFNLLLACINGRQFNLSGINHFIVPFIHKCHTSNMAFPTVDRGRSNKGPPSP